MEKQFFYWDGWDQQDTATFTFYNPVLKVDLKEHKTGTKFDSAHVDFEKGILEFYNFDEDGEIKETFTYNLQLAVV